MTYLSDEHDLDQVREDEQAMRDERIAEFQNFNDLAEEAYRLRYWAMLEASAQRYL